MLCDKCKKREAKIYYTEIVNGEMKEQHLCEECASECTNFHLSSALINKDISVGSILASILGSYQNSNSTKEPSKEPSLQCSTCGMTYEQFLQAGKFGCADCYKTFQKVLSKSLKNLQGSDLHVGKKPRGFETEANRIVRNLPEIERKSILLQEAIEKEEFEDAARLRDEIRALKDQEAKMVSKEEINNA
ncbi:MAG TPA: UvrB/UvrC motif-containing protein [Lachnospiraceae bacterium]|nr:UvrB/UvrC motif-containing protein [Lachnospiraceae bacterium]